jgi:hypothetical protein
MKDHIKDALFIVALAFVAMQSIYNNVKLEEKLSRYEERMKVIEHFIGVDL